MTFPQLCSCAWGIYLPAIQAFTSQTTLTITIPEQPCVGWLPFLVQIHTFLLIPEENCSPSRSLKQKALEFMIFFSLCPTLLESIQDFTVLGLNSSL